MTLAFANTSTVPAMFQPKKLKTKFSSQYWRISRQNFFLNIGVSPDNTFFLNIGVSPSHEMVSPVAISSHPNPEFSSRSTFDLQTQERLESSGFVLAGLIA
jgi:hypothetical protein